MRLTIRSHWNRKWENACSRKWAKLRLITRPCTTPSSRTRPNRDRVSTERSTSKAKNTKLERKSSKRARLRQLSAQPWALQNLCRPPGLSTCNATDHLQLTQILKYQALTFQCPLSKKQTLLKTKRVAFSLQKVGRRCMQIVTVWIEKCTCRDKSQLSFGVRLSKESMRSLALKNTKRKSMEKGLALDLTLMEGKLRTRQTI